MKLYTGSYHEPVTTGDGSVFTGSGKGIVIYDFNEETGEMTECGRFEDAANASAMAVSTDKKNLYTVNELDQFGGAGGGAVRSYRIEEDGNLTLLNRLAVMGEAPCCLCESRNGKYLYIANYNGGSVSCVTVREDRFIKGLERLLIFGGKGKDEIRQEKSHVHTTLLTKGFLWVVDLGLDRISCYQRISDSEEESGGIIRQTRTYLNMPEGYGPRSLAVHPNGKWVFVTNELSNRVCTLEWDKETGKIRIIDDVSSLPSGWKGESALAGAEVSADGRFLYASNRGHDSIVVYRIEKDGHLEPIQWAFTLGKNPRGMKLSPNGKWLLAANQNSDELVVFKRNEKTGLLEEKHRYPAYCVVSLEFLIL